MPEPNIKHVLFLPAWYPYRYDPMFGLFVKRHAEAVTAFHRVTVLYVYGDESFVEKRQVVDATENGVSVVRVYYKKSEKAFLGRPINIFRYLVSLRNGYRRVVERYGRPDICHVNVLTRAGLLAGYLKRFHNIPYIITEHWSRYLPNVNTYKGLLRKCLTRWLVREAGAVTTVTEDLKQAMLRHKLKNPHYHVVANVVDTELFTPAAEKKETDKKIITHVSCFEDRSKNISGILRVVSKLAKERDDFKVRLIGEGEDLEAMRRYAREWGIKRTVIEFAGLQQGNKLVESYQRSDVVLVFSHYENFPVVLNESLSCGVPVVASRVGGIPEHIKPEFGVLVTPGDEQDLKEKLHYMLDHLDTFDSTRLRAYAQTHFSKESVARQFEDIYQQVLGA